MNKQIKKPVVQAGAAANYQQEQNVRIKMVSLLILKIFRFHGHCH